MAIPKALDPDRLTNRCDPASLGFRTTDEVDLPQHIIGQSRAVDAIRFGVGITREGYNMFASGPSGTGKYSSIRQFLGGRAGKMPPPPDICYVHNFDEALKPNMIQLPAGRGAPFRADMAQLVELVQSAIPRAFESDEFRNRRQQLEEKFRAAQEEIFKEVREDGEKKNVALIRTPQGIGFAPMSDGEVISPEDFQKLPEEEQKKFHEDTEALQGKLAEAMTELPRFERQVREDLRKLSQSMTVYAVGHLFDDLRRRYEDLPEIQDYLDAVRRDIVENASEFLHAGDGDSDDAPIEERRARREGMLKRYAVNLLVDNGRRTGAPVVYEDLPNLQSLIGRIEHVARFGALMTDFTMIQPGALHRANGGYLILDARQVLTSPFAWDELKRALRSHQIKIESPERLMSVATTVTLEPEPVPLDLKVVLLGERMIYYLLTQNDSEFNELFKVEVDFEDTMDRSPDSVRMFTHLIAKLVRHEALRPFEAGAVARVIEQASRLADDSTKMSLHMRSICDLLVESDYWAYTNENAHVTAADVQLAIDTKVRRADRTRTLVYEHIRRGTMLIATSGEAVGQINGLTVTQLGKFPFGRPARITARVRLGRGQVVDIEREVELGGPIHSKGVLILSGLLGARYCPDMPLSLAASLVFEQSYSGVEGDSASCAEFYALLSALSEVPIRQSLAVTGSVNQYGEVQAIGGVNEKIEGFFDICSANGLTGDQGVLIPASNVEHLMLRGDVVDAVRDGRFRIWPVAHVDEGIELLTGVAAGERGADGNFPDGTIGAKVEARLRGFAESAREYMRGHGEGNNAGD